MRFVKRERVNLRNGIEEKGEVLSTQRGCCHLTRFGIFFCMTVKILAFQTSMSSFLFVNKCPKTLSHVAFGM